VVQGAISKNELRFRMVPAAVEKKKTPGTSSKERPGPGRKGGGTTGDTGQGMTKSALTPGGKAALDRKKAATTIGTRDHTQIQTGKKKTDKNRLQGRS